ELAERLGTTRQRISRRMDKLERNGVVIKYTVIPNFEKLGYLHAILGITLKAGVDLDEIVEKLKGIEEIKVIEKAIGAHNIVVHVVTQSDMKKMQGIINAISKEIPGIEHMDITFITEVCKLEVF
ncbi:Lrp/AsnC family transcriptional regulator, partial [Thermococcus sp. GR7]